MLSRENRVEWKGAMVWDSEVEGRWALCFSKIVSDVFEPSLGERIDK